MLRGFIELYQIGIWGAKVHPDDQSAFLASNQEILDGRANIHYVEYRAQNKEGKWIWVL